MSKFIRRWRRWTSRSKQTTRR